MDNDTEQYLLLLLADSNLPTGSFIASSGFESYLKHGFASQSKNLSEATMLFVKNSLHATAHMNLPFVSDAHILTHSLRTTGEKNIFATIDGLRDLDNELHIMTLNQVARRASQAQGVALLTLYSKGFISPASSSSTAKSDDSTNDENVFRPLVDGFKADIRREESPGHLPICWGVLTAALGLSLGE